MKLSKETVMDMIEEQVSIPSARMRHRTKLHIAAVLKKGKVLEVAANKAGSRSKGCGYDNWTIHAERAVLKKIGDVTKLEGATLVVIRLARGSTEILNSEPCHSCRCHLEKCMKEYGLKSVYYSV
jgi:hypothetical protein